MSRSPTIGDSSDETVASPRLWELASGVDALYLSAWAELPDALLSRLEVAKKRARLSGAPVPFSFGGIEFGLLPHGMQKYQYWLSHEWGALGVTASTHLPPLHWQPRSEFLHGLGVESSVDAIHTVLEAEVGLHRFGVSRVDLFSDWQGWPVGWADESRFVRRTWRVRAGPGSRSVGGPAGASEAGSMTRRPRSPRARGTRCGSRSGRNGTCLIGR